MANLTFQQLRTTSQSAPGLNAETIQSRILTLLAMLASGQNPDGTTNTAAANVPAGVNMFVPWNTIGSANTLYMSSIAAAHGNYSTGLNNLQTSFPWFTGPTAITINNISSYVNTAYGAGGVIRCGCYQVSNATYPFVFTIGQTYGTLLQEFGTITTVPTGRTDLTVNITIPAATWFFLAAVEQVSASGNRTVGVSTQGGPSPYGTNNFAGGYLGYQATGLQQTGVSGALPANFVPSGNTATDAGIAFSRQL